MTDLQTLIDRNRSFADQYEGSAISITLDQTGEATTMNNTRHQDPPADVRRPNLQRTSSTIINSKPRILVTAAAGRNASAAVLELLRKGFPVRAFVRRKDARSETLRKAGAEIFVGDLFDLSDLRSALVDVQRAYHSPPVAPHLLHGMMLFALAAEEAKLEVVALMSGWNPHPAHPTIHTREHWIANNIYRWMPTVDVIYVNPGIFAFMYLLGLPAIVHFGMLVGSWGDGLNAPPSSEDIGAVAAGVLANPSPHIGKRYRPTGPKLISPHDMADVLTDAGSLQVGLRAYEWWHYQANRLPVPVHSGRMIRRNSITVAGAASELFRA